MWSLYSEGRRFIKIKGLVFALQGIKGARRVANYYFVSVLCLMIFAGGFFILLTHGLHQIHTMELNLTWDSVHSTGTAAMALAGIVLAWSMREERWLEAFGLSQILNEVNPPKAKKSKHAKESGVDEEALRRTIAQIVEEEIHKSYMKHNITYQKNNSRGPHNEQTQNTTSL